MSVICNQRRRNQLLESVLTQSGESPVAIQAHPQTAGGPLGTTQLRAQMLICLRIVPKCVG